MRESQLLCHSICTALAWLAINGSLLTLVTLNHKRLMTLNLACILNLVS